MNAPATTLSRNSTRHRLTGNQRGHGWNIEYKTLCGRWLTLSAGNRSRTDCQRCRLLALKARGAVVLR